MNCRILQGDVFDLLPTVEAGSIDCAVTSPPYWKLRAYLPKDHPLKHLELGQEPTPGEYVSNVVRWCGLVRDCLADHGTLWLNLGDSYSGTASNQNGSRGSGLKRNVRDEAKRAAACENHKVSRGERVWRTGHIPEGNLCLIPQRVQIALQDDGWLVRSVVVWRKPSAMPASLSGWMWVRCRSKVKSFWSESNPHPSKRASGGMNCGVENSGGFETAAEWADCPGCKKCSANGGYVLRRGSWRPTSSWEPVILLAKGPNYFADGEAVKTPPAAATLGRDRYTRVVDDPDEQFAVAHDHETVCDGANLRDVWTIGAEPLKEKHYAAYPSELVYRCLAAGTSQEGYCNRCGSPFVRVVESQKTFQSGSGKSGNAIAGKNGERLQGGGDTGDVRRGPVVATRTLGWRPSCRCENPTPRPGRVLDPFCGSGRTAIVARRLGLDFTGVELNSEFAEMSKRLVKADQPLFNDFGD